MTDIPERLRTALADRYLIERELGRGGMATVYLAEDLRHKRKVALKVLKPELAAVLGAERFVQEITTTASLQHPHILPLFDSGTADGFLFYVMPFIQGETLRAKLDRETQLGVDEALKLTTDVADALHYAHTQGVIHRDIKPENILLAAGRPMVADFGIALALSAAAGGRMTETGLSLGTPHYMSPEQATAEKEISARSDIYSLASVLYEMLAGQPPHLGGSAQQIIMRIIAEPVAPVTALRKSVPPHVADALAKALEKLPADRFESAQAFAQALANPNFTTATSATARRERTMAARSVRSMALGGAGLMIVGAIVGGLASGLMRDGGSEPRLVRFSIPISGGVNVPAGVNSLDVSSDGSRVLFRSGGIVYVRALDDDSARTVVTTVAREGRFSPDGRSLLGGTAGGGIAITELASGSSRPVGRAVPLSRPILGPDGFVYYDGAGGILRVALAGGPVDTLVRGDEFGGTVFPTDALPDGRSLFVLIDVAGRGTDTLAVLDIRSRVLSPLFPVVSSSGARYSPTGHIVYSERGRVLARTIDVARRAVGDEVFTIADAGRSAGAIRFAIGGGTLAYISTDSGSRALMLADRRGDRRTVANLPAGHYENPRVSPRGDRIVVLRTDPNDDRRDVWVYDLASERLSPLTRSGGVGSPNWSSDGQRVAYTRGTELFWRRFDASGEEELLLRRPRRFGQIALTSDRLVFQEGPNAWDIGIAEIGKTGSDSLLMHGDYWEGAPVVSRDGRWLAYYSAEGGGAAIFVQPFLRPGRRVQVSPEGAINSKWSADSRSLFYVQGTTMMEAELTIGADVGVSATKRLFDVPTAGTGTPQFDVFPGGDRFAVTEPPAASGGRAIIVVTDFGRLLRRAP